MPILLAISVLAVLIIVHEAGHFIAARAQGITVTRFSIGFGPVLWKYQGKETEYALRAIPLGGYVAFPDDELDEDVAADDPGLLKNRPILDRAIVISAGVIANLIFAYLLMLTQLGWVGIPELQPQPGVLVSEIAKDVSSAAAQAGLQARDVVVGVNGKTLETGTGAVQFLMTVIKESPNKPVNLDVQRGEQTLSLSVTPKSKSTADQIPRIGVKLGPNGTVIRKKATSISKLFGTAAAEFQSVVIQTVQGFGQLVSNFQETANQVSGPVAIVAIGADIARTDISRLLQFGALISVNLAVINILPLPALDGGQLAFLLIEAFRGKPLPNEVQQGVMQTGLFLLLGLGMFLIVRDTANLGWVQNLLSQ
jgi:membrane-associated protease RseP (regulator of RpoE activity)